VPPRTDTEPMPPEDHEEHAQADQAARHLAHQVAQVLGEEGLGEPGPAA
jgi:hypothetical protein